jgi:hypothetical protein
VTPEQIEAYVQANPRNQPEQRTVRLVVRATARRYAQEGSGAPRTIEPGMLPLRAERAVFKARKNAITRYGTHVFKVTAITPAGPLPLEQQRATAWEVLSSEAQKRAIDVFSAEFRSRWRLSTTCGPRYAGHEDCANPPTVE